MIDCCVMTIIGLLLTIAVRATSGRWSARRKRSAPHLSVVPESIDRYYGISDSIPTPCPAGRQTLHPQRAGGSFHQIGETCSCRSEDPDHPGARHSQRFPDLGSNGTPLRQLVDGMRRPARGARGPAGAAGFNLHRSLIAVCDSRNQLVAVERCGALSATRGGRTAVHRRESDGDHGVLSPGGHHIHRRLAPPRGQRCPTAVTFCAAGM